MSPQALVQAGLEALPAIICAQGELTTYRFIELFSPTIRNSVGTCAVNIILFGMMQSQ